MTLKEAKIFIDITGHPTDWGDENSEFHVNNPVGFKKEFIQEWMHAYEIVIREAGAAQLAEHLLKELPCYPSKTQFDFGANFFQNSMENEIKIFFE